MLHVSREVWGVAGLRIRAGLRRRGGGCFSLILLIGLVGCVAIGAVAAARRTRSSFPWFVRNTNPSDLNLIDLAQVIVGDNPTSSFEPTLAGLPNVKRVASWGVPNVTELESDGTPAASTADASRGCFRRGGSTSCWSRGAEIVSDWSMGAGLILIASVRRRRRDLALLKTLGFAPFQLGAAVAWQSTVAAVIGTIVGVPIRIRVGRWLWRLFAEGIHVVPQPTVLVLRVMLVAVVSMWLANLVAVLPARCAARTAAAVLLRAD